MSRSKSIIGRNKLKQRTCRGRGNRMQAMKTREDESDRIESRLRRVVIYLSFLPAGPLCFLDEVGVGFFQYTTASLDLICPASVRIVDWAAFRKYLTAASFQASAQVMAFTESTPGRNSLSNFSAQVATALFKPSTAVFSRSVPMSSDEMPRLNSGGMTKPTFEASLSMMAS